MNDTSNHPGRLPKLLYTHGKQAAKKDGKVERLSVPFAAHFTELADDQFLTALAWGIAALRDADDPQTRA
jgi:hypothetical protein